MRLIDGYRLANKLPPIAPVAGHVETAASMGLGNASARSSTSAGRAGSGAGILQ